MGGDSPCARRGFPAEFHKACLYLEALEERGWGIGACGADQHKPQDQHRRHAAPSSSRQLHPAASLLHGAVFALCVATHELLLRRREQRSPL